MCVRPAWFDNEHVSNINALDVKSVRRERIQRCPYPTRSRKRNGREIGKRGNGLYDTATSFELTDYMSRLAYSIAYISTKF